MAATLSVSSVWQRETSRPKRRDTMNNRERDAISRAAMVISRLDDVLNSMGRGFNLSNVPGFQGADFVDTLNGIVGQSSNRQFEAPIALPALISEGGRTQGYLLNDKTGISVA